ncbi:MAG: hypothetical protein ACW98K_18770, partial [Candidatus Kariarchaeaceae archaeon]
CLCSMERKLFTPHQAVRGVGGLYPADNMRDGIPSKMDEIKPEPDFGKLPAIISGVEDYDI